MDVYKDMSDMFCQMTAASMINLHTAIRVGINDDGFYIALNENGVPSYAYMHQDQLDTFIDILLSFNILHTEIIKKELIGVIELRLLRLMVCVAVPSKIALCLISKCLHTFVIKRKKALRQNLKCKFYGWILKCL